MSDHYIIETLHGAAGLVVRDRRVFMFFSATREFDVLDEKAFASPQRATAAAIRQSASTNQDRSQKGKKQVALQRTTSKRRIVDKASGSAEREWTAVEKFRLKGLAKQAFPVEKIARTLKRPVDATVAMATKLGHRLM